MSRLQFDGKSYDELGLAQALKDAAHGMPDTDDHHHLHDGTEWARRLVEAAVGSPFAATAGAVVGQLLVSEDAEVRRLAVSLQYDSRLAGADDTLTAMRHHAQLGQREDVTTLAAALARIDDRGEMIYSAELREFAAAADSLEPLLCVYLRHDLPWVIAHLSRLVPAELGPARSLLATGTARMTPDERRQVAIDLLPALAALGGERGQVLVDDLRRTLR